MKIAILGKGNVGARLGALFSSANGIDHVVTYSTRTNVAEIAKQGEMLVLAVPYSSVASLVPDLQDYVDGKIIIDATNPLNSSDWSPLEDVGYGAKSGAEAIQIQLPQAKIVKAFNTIFADNLTEDRKTDVTVFVAGDDAEARRVVHELATSSGFDSVVETGPLMTSRYLEAMAHLNIQLAVGMGHGTNTGFAYVERTGGGDEEQK
jgi:8-hydroxy-5-deazaflavin:NADPH oxidoreductase